MFDKVKVIEYLGNSDHNIIAWELICDSSISENKQQIRLFSKAKL
jgi:hypothetical protein